MTCAKINHLNEYVTNDCKQSRCVVLLHWLVAEGEKIGELHMSVRFSRTYMRKNFN